MKHMNFFEVEKSKSTKYTNYIMIFLILIMFTCEGYILKKKLDITKTFNKIDYTNAREVRRNKDYTKKIDEEIKNICAEKEKIIDEDNINDLLLLTIIDIVPDEISLDEVSISKNEILLCGKSSSLGSLQNYKNRIISLNVFENMKMETRKGKKGYEFNLSFNIGMK